MTHISAIIRDLFDALDRCEVCGGDGCAKSSNGAIIACLHKSGPKSITVVRGGRNIYLYRVGATFDEYGLPLELPRSSPRNPA